MYFIIRYISQESQILAVSQPFWLPPPILVPHEVSPLGLLTAQPGWTPSDVRRDLDVQKFQAEEILCARQFLNRRLYYPNYSSFGLAPSIEFFQVIPNVVIFTEVKYFPPYDFLLIFAIRSEVTLHIFYGENSPNFSYYAYYKLDLEVIEVITQR